MVRCCDATAGSSVTKVQDEVFAQFHTVSVKRHMICRIDCLACQDEFFVHNPLDAVENDEHALDFALHLSHLFRSQ
jgi:hypothetical protein